MINLKALWQNILDYVFPKECFACKKEGEYLCSECFSRLELIDKFTCFICNGPETEKGVCEKCATETGIDRIIIAAKYRNNVAGQIVESFKYDFVQDLASILVKILEKQINRRGLASFMHQQILLPVPLHKKRLAERGFNQAEELAKGIGALYDCLIENELLNRVKNTGQQAKLSRSERFSNIENAFQGNLKTAVPERVVLVDDVLTSGATFIQAAKALRQAGVKEIACLAVCHG
ncbi:MAG: ComF family protein [Parcubacteria group bacterium]